MIATWLSCFDISKVDKKNWDFRPNIIFFRAPAICAIFAVGSQLLSSGPNFNQS